VLAQIWNLADYDKDGKLSLEEFILATHLCDYAKLGNLIPASLPAELIPTPRPPSQMGFDQMPVSPPSTSLNMFPNNMNNLSGLAAGSVPLIQQAQPPQAGNAGGLIGSFEDKRKENFDKGNAVLEAKRQQLREQEEREKREREEKERIEQEKKQKIKEEQERRRQVEIEKQMERQRLLDLQREEERKKLFEQREAARNELIRQQRLEWEKQKKNELETQKLKLQEQLSTLKAKDKNLEYDMQILVKFKIFKSEKFL
jgi:intersectin